MDSLQMPLSRPNTTSEIYLSPQSRAQIKGAVWRLNMPANTLTDAQLIKIAGILHISCTYVRKEVESNTPHKPKEASS